jgi:DNA-directed RNA polymerase specialized sigma subunit
VKSLNEKTEICEVGTFAQGNGRRIEDLLTPGASLSESSGILAMLAHRMARLPAVTRKILAMYFHENLPKAGIAACLDLPVWRIDEILGQTIGLLQNDLRRFSR